MNFPDRIDAASFPQYQREEGSRIPVYFSETTESTNADAARMIASGGMKENFACLANTQTAGRGRIPGRRWESVPGNIFLSCGFLPQDVPPSRLANFTLWIGVATARMLRESFDLPVVVKWPNDIWCRGKKMAGMLTEAHADSGRIRGIIFGIGLNVNLDAETLSANADFRATSLRAELGGKPLDVNRVCARLLHSIETAYNAFIAGTHSRMLAECWNDFDCLYGKRVVAVYGEEKISGIACGIDAGGNLRLREENGTLRIFSAGDVSLRSV